MKFLFIFFFSIISLSLSAQNIARQILDQIPMSEDTVNSVFSWVAQYMIYDSAFPNHKRKYSEPKELIDYALKERSGICQHYAELFHYLISELDYPSYVISGFSNHTPGNSHAWNAVKMNGSWYLFDPTFASGGVTSSGRFIKEYDERWYKVRPDQFIKTHMPYDYIWQFQSSPISFKSFEENTFDEVLLNDINYEKEVNKFVRVDDKEWCNAAIERINKQSYRNSMISNHLSYLNSVSYGLEINEKVDAHNLQVDKLNVAVELFNNSAASFNDYLTAKNNAFRTSAYSKEVLTDKMNRLYQDVSKAMDIFSSIDTHNEITMKVVQDNLRLGRIFLQNIRKEQEFIQSYLTRFR